MKRTAMVVAAFGALSFALPPAASAAPQNTALTCAPMQLSAPAGAKVESVTAVRQPGGTVTFPPSPIGTPAPINDVPAYCEFTVTITHGREGDHENIKVAVPETGWTGRFLAAGGSAYAAGDFGAALVQGVKDGYATASSDAGFPLSPLDASWGLTADGRINQSLLANFGSRSVHDVAVIGKDVAAKYYHRKASYSYWNGCSTGGRQGYVAAQQFPEDFDGIAATAPATNWAEFAVATAWPAVVMNQERTFPTSCEFAAFNAAAVKACDSLDGVTNGVIDLPEKCGYDPRGLVGTKVLCNGAEETITAQDAEVVRKIWAGPTDERGRKLWPGLPKGADFSGIAATEGQSAPGFFVATAWIKTFLKRQPDFDISTVTYRQFVDLFRQSVAQYDDIIGTSDPDLSAFRAAGGKLVTWHGTADQLINPQDSVLYRQRAEREVPRANSFYRLFLAPGVGHCQSSTSPFPANPLGAVVNWVERGQAPDVLPASLTDATGKTFTRNLCPYPQVSEYRGYGDPAVAASYRCSR